MEIAFIEKNDNSSRYVNLSSVKIFERNNLSFKKIQFPENRNVLLNVFDYFYDNFLFLDQKNTAVNCDCRNCLKTSELLEYYMIL